MSCVSDFLAFLPSSGTSYSAAVWEGEKAPELCWEYRFTHMTTSWMHIVHLELKHEAGLGKPGNVFKCPTYSSGTDIKLCIQIRLLLKKTAGCNGSDITPEVEFLSFFFLFFPWMNVNLIHSHTAVVFEALLLTLLLLSTISVKRHVKFKPRFVLSSCWSTNSVCVFTHIDGIARPMSEWLQISRYFLSPGRYWGSMEHRVHNSCLSLSSWTCLFAVY